jgi:hypothetical protein
MSGHRGYVAVETAISLAINVALSGAFAWAVFGHRAVIAVAGASGYAVDFLPQTFMISLMSILVPTLLTRRRLAAGKLAPAAGRPWAPARLVIRAPVGALAATVVVGGGALLASLWGAPGSLAFGHLLVLKLVYGALVAGLVTPLGLAAALRDPV